MLRLMIPRDFVTISTPHTVKGDTDIEVGNQISHR